MHAAFGAQEPAQRQPRRPAHARTTTWPGSRPSPTRTPIWTGSSAAAGTDRSSAVDEGPRKEDLDAIVPDRPVFLLNNDVHGAWVNSRALEAAGITASSPDPWDGYAVRDADGSPTGCLQEGAAYDVLRTVVAPPSLDQWKVYLRRAQRELHALGITGWQDAWVEPGLLRGLSLAGRRGRPHGARGDGDVVGPPRRHGAGGAVRGATRAGHRRPRRTPPR